MFRCIVDMQVFYLKFFAKRLVEAKTYGDEGGDGLFEMIRER